MHKNMLDEEKPNYTAIEIEFEESVEYTSDEDSDLGSNYNGSVKNGSQSASNRTRSKKSLDNVSKLDHLKFFEKKMSARLKKMNKD